MSLRTMAKSMAPDRTTKPASIAWPDDPKGKLDITRCAQYWLKDYEARGIQHICWDGCMFPNAALENPATWDTILSAMVDVRDTVG